MLQLSYIKQALTLNGDANGILTVASTGGFGIGATVYLNSNTKPTVALIIDTILSSTTLAVKTTEGFTYTRFNASAYLVADNASVTQPSQTNFFLTNQPAGSVEIQSAGVDLGPADTLNFTGAITASNSAGVATITVPAGGGLVLGAFGTTPDVKGATLVAGTLALQPADGTHPGSLSTLAQTIAGPKTFSAAIVASLGVQLPEAFNVNGSAPTDVCVKAGTSLADGSVDASAKLFSVRTGLQGGTEVEKMWVDKTGNIRLGGAAGAGAFYGQSATLGRFRADDAIGCSMRYNNLELTLTGGALQLFNHNLANLCVVASSGRIDRYGTDSSASPGPATIDKPTGISAIANGSTSVMITNALATTTSRIMITWLGDLGVQTKTPWVTRGVGSFTVNVASDPGANVSFAWEVSSIL